MNFRRVLKKAGFPSCYVTLPDYALGDLQVSAEYVVSAIRAIRKRAGRDIGIYGHSQGGLLSRWALSYWPSLRKRVADVVTVAATHHGTDYGDDKALVDGVCAVGCAPAFLQQRTGSNLLGALNARRNETPGKSQWTAIRTLTDEFVQPQNGPAPTSSLRGATNVAIQDVCPGREVAHNASQYDSVSYALLLDALRHRRAPAASRLPSNVCAHRFAPGIGSAAADEFAETRRSVALSRAIAYEPKTSQEPDVRSSLASHSRAVGRDSSAWRMISLMRPFWRVTIVQ